MVAVRVPDAEGLNVTWNVVVPDAETVAAGELVNEKSAELVPEIITDDMVKSAAPLFSIVNVLIIELLQTG